MLIPIGNLLGDAIKRNKIMPEMTATSAMGFFKDAARSIWGGQVSQNMNPEYIKNGSLAVRVAGNIYAQEIKFHEKELVAEVNLRAGRKIVERIRCLV